MTRTSLATAVALLALAAPASAAVSFAPCPAATIGPPGAQCASVAVPLDRTGAVPGTIDVGLERLPARGADRGTVLALAGGPGDAASATFARAGGALDALRTDHDVVLVDQRGTGRSGPIVCATTVADCAARLGPAANLYTTAAFADDLEGVRAALGVDRVTLFGISYGTYAAAAYARRQPTHVAALVLDSILDQPMADDRFRLEAFAAVPRALRSECAGDRCHGVTKDPYRDLVAVVKAIGAGRIRGVTVPQIGAAVFQSDANGDLRAELPAALAAARRGDPALLRQVGAAASLPIPFAPSLSSDGLFTAASCDDYAQAWDRSITDPAARAAEAKRRFEAIAPARFAPFPPALAYPGDVDHCLDWPIPTVSPQSGPPAPLPDVPALLLAGGADLRTPDSGARRLAAQLPRAKLLELQAVGHGVTFDNPCAQRAIAAFLGGRAVRGCPAQDAPFRPLIIPPNRVAGGLARAAAVTLGFSVATAAARADAQLARTTTDRFAGLRGGVVTRRGATVTLHDVVVVPGVRVSGTPGHLRARRV